MARKEIFLSVKILWFTSTASLYDVDRHFYQGVGWIESLEELARQHKGIDLAVSFFHPNDSVKVIKGASTYYPIKIDENTKLKKLFNRITGQSTNIKSFAPKFKEVIDDFEPDVIQVFGTENMFPSIQNMVEIPVVIHIQGILNPVINAFYPPNFSKYNFLFSLNYLIKNLIRSSPIFHLTSSATAAQREIEYFKNCRFLMGRTHWDKKVTNFLAPQATYFHLEEVLRPAFYKTNKVRYQKGSVLQIFSTLSPTIYKGLDTIVKTAILLQTESNISFEWQIAGINKNDKLLKLLEKSFNISHSQLNIKCLGVVKPEELCKSILDSDVFIHASYIDNSPNSVCEAQMLGTPVIACNVGGLSTLVNHGETGVLVPSNGVYELAYTLKEFDSNPEKYFEMGKKARKIALRRHDKENIIDRLIGIYREIAK